MPIHKVKKGGKTGYRWGKHGKVYTGRGARGKALRQARAAYAHGYKEK